MAGRILFAVITSTLPLSAQWGRITTPAAPGPTTSAPMAFDVWRGRSLLLEDSQLWSFDGATWAPLASTNLPTGLPGTSMAFDIATGKAMVYGGIPPSTNSTPNSNEFWLWDGTDWSPGPSGPPGLARYAVAYDLLRARMVLYGGIQNVYLNSTISAATWEFDGTSWSVSGSNGPGPRERHSMCFAVNLGATVLFGGSNMQNGPFGGPSYDDDTWLYDGTTWQLAAVPGVRPAPRVDASMVYDLARGVCVLTGGQDPVTMTVFDETWEFDGAWRLVSDGQSPPRTRASMCYDQLRSRPVLFGGRTAPLAVLDETWEYAASHRLYGLGCLGTFGRPTLVPGARPRLGATGSVTLNNLAPSATAAVFTYGFSASQWAFGSLPASLAFVGMTGCVAYASADDLVFAAASGGRATWSFQVPGDPLLFGLQVYVQALSFDATRNAAGLVSSNGDILTLGW